MDSYIVYCSSLVQFVLKNFLAPIPASNAISPKQTTPVNPAWGMSDRGHTPAPSIFDTNTN